MCVVGLYLCVCVCVCVFVVCVCSGLTSVVRDSAVVAAHNLVVNYVTSL